MGQKICKQPKKEGIEKGNFLLIVMTSCTLQWISENENELSQLQWISENETSYK